MALRDAPHPRDLTLQTVAAESETVHATRGRITSIEKWKVGGSSPQFMTTCGWNKKTLQPGDVITVIGFRVKDGSNAARMQTILMPNGKEMYYGAPPLQTAHCVPPAP